MEPIIGDQDQSGVFLNKSYYCGDCNVEMAKINVIGRCATCVNLGNIVVFKCPRCNKKIRVFQGESCMSCDEIMNIER